MRRRTIRRSWRILVALLTVLGTVTVMAGNHGVPVAHAANLLTNGSFDTGSTSPWFINTHNGGTANPLGNPDTSEHFDGTASAKVVVTNLGTGTPTPDWNVQLGQTGMNLTSGTTYLLTYEVMSNDANRTVRATLQQDVSPFTQYANTNCTTGTAFTWRQCTLTFTPSGALSGVDLYFDVSQALDTVWFDAVSVQSLGTNLISNGTFESGSTSWFINHQNSATTSDTNIVQSADNFDPSFSGAITITNQGTGTPPPDWSVQLGQTGLSLTGGNTYTLYYEAKSTTASRVIRAALQQDASPFTLYQSSSCTLSSTANTWTQCSLTVTPSSNLTGVDLWFNLNQNADTVKLDDISLTGAAPGSAPTINHVFVIMMENLDWSMIKGDTTDAPYINNTLLPESSYATQYYDVAHPSLPNYLWLEAGTCGTTGDYCGNDYHPTDAPLLTTNHLTKQLNTAGLSWKVYAEGISDTTCPTMDSGFYAVRHNANMYFSDVNGNNTYCTAHEKSYATDFSTDIGSETTTARYNLILPDLCDDDHWATGCSYADTQAARVHAGDTWLSNNVPAILNSAAYKDNGLLLITWDESQNTSINGPIGMIALSPLAKGGGYNNSVSYTHSSTLKTLEEIYGVSLLNDASSTTTTDFSDLFNAGAIP